MPFNPNEAIADAARLPFGVLSIEGADAVAFAQAQFTSDVAALADGAWQWSAWLTPKGRVIALFLLLRIDASTLWLVLPDAPPEALRERLQRFVFRSKVVLRARADLQVLGRFGAPPEPAADRGHVLRLAEATGARTLYVGPAGTDAEGNADTNEGVFAACWRRADIAHGIPRLGADQAEQWTPQMLGLDRLAAVSLRKGCYPGQEIVSRTHYLGQAKRGPLRLLCEGARAGAEVTAGAAVVGHVVCAEGDEALAVVNLDQQAAALLCRDRACVAAPFLD